MTFQVTNLQTNKISEFTNRAQFLYEMEQIGNKTPGYKYYGAL